MPILREDLLKPISPENPTGISIKREPIYDQLREARREDDDAAQGDWVTERKVADHKVIIKLAQQVLAEQSKDMEVAVWLTESLLKQHGFAGLLEGLQLVKGLTETYWVDLYPKVSLPEKPADDSDDDDAKQDYEDALSDARDNLGIRVGLVERLGGKLDLPLRLTGWVKGGLSFYKFKESREVGYEADASTPEKQEARRIKIETEGKLTAEDWDKAEKETPTPTLVAHVEALDGCLATLKELEADCTNQLLETAEKLGLSSADRDELVPTTKPVRDTLTEIRHTIWGIVKKRPDAPGSASDAADGGGETAAEGAVVGGGGGGGGRGLSITGVMPASEAEVPLRLEAVAKFLRRQDPNSPGPYLMLRGLRWGELRGFGTALGPQHLPAPASELRQTVKLYFLNKKWEEMIEAAETVMSTPGGRAWLDLQRYVCTACEELGRTLISDAIKAELRALLADYPHLPRQTMLDDSLTANGDTQSWIEELLSAEPPPPRAVVELEPVIRASAQPDSSELAEEAVRRSKPEEALTILARDIAQQSTNRGRFIRKAQLAKILLDMGNTRAARPLVNDLIEMFDSHKLDSWEHADFISPAMELIYSCINQTDGETEVVSKMYSLLARLDPARAVKLG